ncbi:hypothetical protein, conserved [Eimeria brunetti]|uniref:Uncharacterized protein n=1 Tax=Eimeria brunetti TaxID=51314 RepID=U6LIV0_9EIME|nr:hypothetical protein, conserved [Eimeria brunetti]
MRRLLPHPQPPIFRSFPATSLPQVAHSGLLTWWEGAKRKEIRTSVYRVAPVAQDAKAQQSRHEALKRGADKLVSQQLRENIRIPLLRQVVPETIITAPAATTGVSLNSQLRVSCRSLASINGDLPYFLSDLQSQRYRGSRADDSASDGGETDDEALGTAVVLRGDLSDSANPQLRSAVSTEALDARLDISSCDNTSEEGERRCDLLRLQSRYDALLRNPQAFSTQLQLLHACIQRAQQQHTKSVYMKQLQPLQERIRTPGANACLQVHPLLYAAFCIYCPSQIHIAAAKRVGAAEHFVEQYLKARTKSKGYRRRSLSDISTRNRAAAEEWLASASLSNICVYPLEALSPELRLFSLTAPQRLAAWEDILSRALAS